MYVLHIFFCLIKILYFIQHKGKQSTALEPSQQSVFVLVFSFSMKNFYGT